MKRYLLFACLVASPWLSQAASFACNKAVHADEKAICANRSLNDKDVEMATKYQFLKGLFAMGRSGDMADSQQAWLKQRQACGGNVQCLTQRYQQRIAELNKIYDSIEKPL